METQVNNDDVAGAAELRAATGAEIVGPAAAGYAFAFLPIADGTEVELGDGSLMALATPGHTPEHTSYLLRDADGRQVALFSGGSLIVGSAGRTDLLGADRADELARAQFRTMRRLAVLPADGAPLPPPRPRGLCAGPPPGGGR